MTEGAPHSPIAFRRLRIELAAPAPPWAVSVDYYRHLRAAVYDLLALADPVLARFLHRTGFHAALAAIDWQAKREASPAPPAAESFKLFCFSGLIGTGRLARGGLTFPSPPVSWFFATPVAFTAEALVAGLRQAGALRIGRTSLTVTRIEDVATTIAPSLACALLSPLVVSRADKPSRQRRYLLRGDDEAVIEARLRANLLAKHRALFGADPADPDFRFQWTDEAPSWVPASRPTRLVRLSARAGPEVRVRGSVGGVRIAGSPDLLRVALTCGLGQHNASGMGFLLPEGDWPRLQT